MPRFAAKALIELLAAAIGLLVAVWLLPGMSITFTSFLIVVAVFTVARFALEPLIARLSSRYAEALLGGVALVATFVALVISALVSSGLVISGLTTWVLATLIVWLFDVIAALVLPRLIFKEILTGKPAAPATPAPPPAPAPDPSKSDLP